MPLEQVHPAGIFEGTIEGAELPLRYQLEVDYGDGGHVHARGPVRVRADARRARPAPDRRGPPRGALRAARRARPRAPGRDRHGVRGLGAGGTRGQRRRRLQLLGRAPARDALAGLRRDLGAVPARRRAGRALQVRDPDPRRRPGPEGRPVRAGSRGAPEDRLGRHRVTPRVERRQVPGAAALGACRSRSRSRSTRSTSGRGG